MAPSLLTAVDSTDHVHLIVGSNSLAGARCTKSLEVGAKPVLVSLESGTIHYDLANKAEAGKIVWKKSAFQDDYLTTLGRPEVDGVVDAVFVTLSSQDSLRFRIFNLCRRLRIPINVIDSPTLSTFTLLSTHTDGPLQIGISTSGKGCKLASRIKREIVSTLPSEIGSAVERLGNLRKKLYEEDVKLRHSLEDDMIGEDDDGDQSSNFNRLVTPEDTAAARDRRMRWIAQICEYWPLKRLAAISDADVQAILESYCSETSTTASLEPNPSNLDTRLLVAPRKATIILAGSGPGSPELLTIATLNALRAADVILADKLVPSPVLDLIPRRTLVHIARKFPGNADAAQEELLNLGIAALRENKIVLRLKQGDPYLYGRGGEELLWFRERGYNAIVLPGVTSALSAPLFARVPVTMRNVADQVVVCTGTGRKGVVPVMPEYVESKTVILLMALHRIGEIVAKLTSDSDSDSKNLWPISTPCVIVERASCRDQRIIRSTLQHVCAAVEELGSRPPGLLVVGRACAALETVTDRWIVEEGFSGFEEFGGGLLMNTE